MPEEKNKGGRPSLTNGKTKRISVALTKEQKRYMKQKYGAIAKGIRALIDADMQATLATDISQSDT